MGICYGDPFSGVMYQERKLCAWQYGMIIFLRLRVKFRWILLREGLDNRANMVQSYLAFVTNWRQSLT